VGDDDYEPPSGPTPQQPIDWRLTRFLARHCATGVAAAWSLLLGLLWTDVGNLRTLLDNSGSGWLALLVLAASFGLTGGAVAMAVAVMTIGSGDDR